MRFFLFRGGAQLPFVFRSAQAGGRGQLLGLAMFGVSPRARFARGTIRAPAAAETTPQRLFLAPLRSVFLRSFFSVACRRGDIISEIPGELG